ncbi:hypothetical protein [Pseudanabaena sp. Chao 1811]|uniref:hypothetical protein n=1 Tax=Pseudanabaena sp. Chao 1811 TaxID=2963092 RepID=UPI0022F3E393|nr:hypothetical protein [Pseudanabaena sp. Chao 1811]
MLSIAELAHQRDPQAIAEIIRQELQTLDSNRLDVEVSIVDSNLELQIRTDSAIDKEKLLTLVSSNLRTLHIESVAKFKIHCWRNDDEMNEQRLLWTEQFMMESLSSSLSKPLELESEHLELPESLALEKRSPETQLSKDSVLQKAINNLSSNSTKTRKQLLPAEQLQEPILVGTALNNLATPPVEKHHIDNQSTNSTNNYHLQLLLVGLSIILLGLGIGALVRAITSKNVISPNAEISSSNLSVNKSSDQNPQNIKSQSLDPALTTNPTKPSSTKALPTLPADTTVNSTPNISDLTPSNPTQSPSTSQEDDKPITLEKFNRVQKGMTVEQVDKIFGVSGKVIAENTTNNSVGQVYSWKNPQGSNAIVEFKDGQVVAKAQAGL